MILIVKDNSDDSYCKRQLIVKDNKFLLYNSDDSYCKRQQ